MSNSITAPVTVIQNTINAPVTLGIIGSGGASTWASITGKPAAVTALTGTNTGDQTSIVGISGTKAQFQAAMTDDDFVTLAGAQIITGSKTFDHVTASIFSTVGVNIYAGDFETGLIDVGGKVFIDGDIGTIATGGIYLAPIDGAASGFIDLSEGSTFIYGTGVAAAHRTALGLTNLATLTTGTGVTSALSVAIGSAGSFIVNGGAGGTPSSITLTNGTGLPIVGGTTGTLSVARGGTGGTDASTARIGLTLGTGDTVTFGGVISTGGMSLAGGSSVLFTGRSRMKSTSDGEISFRNNADTAPSNISAGGIISSGTVFTGGTTLTTLPKSLIQPAVNTYTGVTGVAATDIITATGHAFANGDTVGFTAITGGTGLAVTTRYFVISVSGSTFQLSLTSGGAAINFTTDITAATITNWGSWSTAGTMLGVNAASGFAGDLLNLEVGGTSLVKIDSVGNILQAPSFGAQGGLFTNRAANQASLGMNNHWVQISSADIQFFSTGLQTAVLKNNRFLIGTATDDGSNKFQVTGNTALTGNLAVTGATTLSTLVQSPAASATPASNGQLVFEATSNTSITVKYRGTDGTVRSAVLLLT